MHDTSCTTAGLDIQTITGHDEHEAVSSFFYESLASLGGSQPEFDRGLDSGVQPADNRAETRNAKERVLHGYLGYLALELMDISSDIP